MTDQAIRPVTPTQVRHPWRATLRTGVAVVLAMLPIMPQVVDELGLGGYAWAVGFLGVVAGITRVLAIPTVNLWIQKWLPALAATPPKP